MRKVQNLCYNLHTTICTELSRVAVSQGEPFLLELDWRQFHQQEEACRWLGEFGAAVAYPEMETPLRQALLLRGAASHWPAVDLVSVDWLVHNTTVTKPLYAPHPLHHHCWKLHWVRGCLNSI